MKKKGKKQMKSGELLKIFNSCREGLGSEVNSEIITKILDFWGKVFPSLYETKYMFTTEKSGKAESVWFFTEKDAVEIRLDNSNCQLFPIQNRIINFSIQKSDFKDSDSAQFGSKLSFTFRTDFGIEKTLEAKMSDKCRYLMNMMTEYFSANLNRLNL